MGLFTPERRLYAEFVNGLDEAAHIMAQDFAQHFVDWRRVCLAPQLLPEFVPNHAEHRLDVRAPVLVLFELRIVEPVDVIHALPQLVLLLLVVVEITTRDEFN